MKRIENPNVRIAKNLWDTGTYTMPQISQLTEVPVKTLWNWKSELGWASKREMQKQRVAAVQTNILEGQLDNVEAHVESSFNRATRTSELIDHAKEEFRKGTLPTGRYTLDGDPIYAEGADALLKLATAEDKIESRKDKLLGTDKFIDPKSSDKGKVTINFGFLAQ